MRKHIPLHALRIFEAAAHHRSFARAAEELNVTPTAVSHQIKQLEELVGQPLFRRFPRPISLTSAGERLYPVLKTSLNQIAAAMDALNEDTGMHPLVISVTAAFASRWLLPRMVVLEEQTQFDLDIRATESVANLRDGDIECAVRYTTQPPEDYEAQLLATDRYIPVASPDYAEKCKGIPWAQKQLIQYQWKNPTLDAPGWKKYLTALETSGVDVGGVDVTKAYRLSEESHAIESALAGHGIALVSDILIKQEIVEGRLVQIGNVSIPGLSFYVVYPPDAPRRRMIEEFLLWARDEIMDVEEKLEGE